MHSLRSRIADFVAAAAFALVLAVALLLPWDPNASGGVGFPIACLIAVVAALIIGNQSPGRTALAQGALVGSLAAIAFVVGTFVAYEQGWHSRSWDEFGESDPGLFELAFTIVFVGLPAALIGAVLAILGRTTRRLV